MAPEKLHTIGNVCEAVGVNVNTLKKWIDDGFIAAGTQAGKWRWFGPDQIVSIAVLHALTAGGAGIPLRYAAEVVRDQNRYFRCSEWYIFAGITPHDGFSYRGSTDHSDIQKWLNRTGDEDDDIISPTTAVIVPVHRIRRRVLAALEELEA